MPAPTVLAGGHLTIGGIEVGVNTYGAWRIIDLPILWHEAKQRGADRTLPSVAGQKAYQRRRDVTERTVTMQIFGDVDGQTGSLYTDSRQGLEANWFYLNANVVKPTGLTDGTRSAVLYMPSGASLTKTVHATTLECDDWTTSSHFIKADFTLSIPGGTFLT